MAKIEREMWPFADPPDRFCVSLRRIFEGGASILLVCHDADDGSWQFLDGGKVNREDGVAICLEHAWRHDPSIAELHDLPMGWQAKRSAIGKSWKRKRL